MFYCGSDVSSIAVAEELLHDFIAMDDHKVAGKFSKQGCTFESLRLHERTRMFACLPSKRKSSVNFLIYFSNHHCPPPLFMFRRYLGDVPSPKFLIISPSAINGLLPLLILRRKKVQLKPKEQFCKFIFHFLYSIRKWWNEEAAKPQQHFKRITFPFKFSRC